MARALAKEIKDTRKNYIINGDMRISQRKTLFTSVANATYTLDRFAYFKSGAMVHSVAQDSDCPTVAQAGYLFQNSLLTTVTTIDNSLAAGEYSQVQQKIEGYNWANLAQKACTLSFWVKSSQTGTYCVALTNSGNDRSCVMEYTINSANTWEYKAVVFPASPSAGTWNYGTGIGVSVQWCLGAGTQFQTTPGTWQTGNFFATSNQVNANATIVTSWAMTGACLNEGLAAVPFKTFGDGSITSEANACKRYYEKSYQLVDPPGTLTQNGAIQFGPGTTTHRDAWVTFSVEKRVAPSMTAYSPDSGATGQFRNRSTNADVAGNFGEVGTTRTYSSFSPTVGQHYAYHYTAECEL